LGFCHSVVEFFCSFGLFCSIGYYLHLVPQLRMSIVVPPPPLCVYAPDMDAFALYLTLIL
jgi:hypothetical protein